MAYREGRRRAMGIRNAMKGENTSSVASRGGICVWLVFPLLWASSAIAGDMVSIPGGTFVMGSSRGEEDESPAHRVRISPFKMDKYEVTAAEYDSCVRRGACMPAH